MFDLSFGLLPPAIVDLLIEATKQTLYMVAASGLIGTLIGLPLGVFLATSRAGGVHHQPQHAVEPGGGEQFPSPGSSPAPPSAPMRPSCR